LDCGEALIVTGWGDRAGAAGRADSHAVARRAAERSPRPTLNGDDSSRLLGDGCSEGDGLIARERSSCAPRLIEFRHS